MRILEKAGSKCEWSLWIRSFCIEVVYGKLHSFLMYMILRYMILSTVKAIS